MRQSVFEIDLFLLHRKEFFLVAQPHFGNNHDDVLQITGRDDLDLGLPGRRHVMRLSSGLPNRNREFDRHTRIGGEPLLFDRDVHDVRQILNS